MMPEEWPIAAHAVERDTPARAAGRSRLSTVRADFFLSPAERLTEQERALMTAMLHRLISDISIEIRAYLPPGWAGANDDDSALVQALAGAGLLDDPELIALLLRRADEERIGAAARARNGRRESRALQGLVSRDSGTVSAPAMALILARGRRRNRFGQCLVGFDDLSRKTANGLVHAIAAALRQDIAAAHGEAAADSELSSASARLLATYEPSRGLAALTAALVALLDAEDSPGDDLLLVFAQDGEVGVLGEVFGRRSGIPADVAFDRLLSGNSREVMTLLRVAGASRELTAGLLAGIGDLLGIADPGGAISLFDSMTPDQVQAASIWLGAAPAYRRALDALGTRNG